MAGLRPTIMALLIVLLFSVCLIGFAVNFLQTTNPTSPAIVNDKYNLTGKYNTINEQLQNVTNVATQIKGDLSGSQPSATDYLFLIFQGAFTIPITIFKTVVNSVSIFGDMIKFGIGSNTGASTIISLSLGLLTVGLIITIVLLTIKNIRSGESER